MAIINCPECGKEISDKATMCPHCGYSSNAGNLHSFNSVGYVNSINNQNALNKVHNDSVGKKTKKIMVGVDTVIQTVCSILFIIFLYTETFFKYYLVTAFTDDYEHYIPTGNFGDLLLYGIGDGYQLLIGLVIVFVIIMLLLSWIKCLNAKLRSSVAFGVTNLIFSVILSILFVSVVFIARADFYSINSYGGVDFSRFLAGFYIELVLLVAFFVCSILSIVKASSNKKNMTNAQQVINQQISVQPTVCQTSSEPSTPVESETDATGNTTVTETAIKNKTE